MAQDLPKVKHTPPNLAGALHELLAAWQYAEDLGQPMTDFAVEIHGLTGVGLSYSDVRWLICNGYVQHFIDTTRLDQAGRFVDATESLSLSPQSCFVLTAEGVAFAQSMWTSAVDEGRNSDPLNDCVLPSWDAEQRVLRLGKQIVRQFAAHAPAQEQILEAFEREGWPQRIDDPLSPDGDVHPSTRLNKAIHRLNKHVNSPHMHFCSDGSGHGVRWCLDGAVECPAEVLSRKSEDASVNQDN